MYPHPASRIPHSPRLLSIALLTLLAVPFAPARADACSCLGGIPLCETFWNTDVVFSGEVLEISLTDDKAVGLYRRVRLRVLETWRGTPGETVELRTGAGGGDCGYSFEKGTQYLVFARAGGGGLSTGICSRTQPLARAAADLQYLRTAIELPPVGRIYGAVRAYRQGGGSGHGQPLAGYQVEISDGSRTWKAVSGPGGEYEFTGMTAGAYKIAVTARQGERAFGESSVTLGDARGCAHADFYVGADKQLP